MPQTILVTSATGKIGTELVGLASSAGHRVRVATRQLDGARARLLQAFAHDRVEPVAFDVADPTTLARAFEGVTRLMLIAPFSPDMLAWHERVVEAARTAGSVSFIAKVSVTGARAPDSDPPPGNLPLQHWRGEEVCRSSGIATCAIRPTIFAQHFTMGTGLYERGDDRFYLPIGEAGVAWLDCRDIAACALALLQLDDPSPWAGRSFELTGPEAITAPEIAEVLSLVAGRPITWVDGMDAFSRRCAELGKPDRIKAIYAEAAGGWFGEPHTAELEQLLGRRPTSFAKFASDVLSAWVR
jgi:uncharacterized protein YbjT (DUF2867 family)